MNPEAVLNHSNNSCSSNSSNGLLSSCTGGYVGGHNPHPPTPHHDEECQRLDTNPTSSVLYDHNPAEFYTNTHALEQKYQPPHLVRMNSGKNFKYTLISQNWQKIVHLIFGFWFVSKSYHFSKLGIVLLIILFQYLLWPDNLVGFKSQMCLSWHDT